jgi:hypothetical protein
MMDDAEIGGGVCRLGIGRRRRSEWLGEDQDEHEESKVEADGEGERRRREKGEKGSGKESRNERCYQS